MTVTIALCVMVLVAWSNGYRMGCRHGADRVALDWRHGERREDSIEAFDRLDKLLGPERSP
jgi:hypothetical protein